MYIFSFCGKNQRANFYFNLNYSIFTEKEIAEIKNMTLYDVIISSTSIQPDEIQKNVFFFRNGDPCPQKEQLAPDVLEKCKYLRGYDYFEVNKLNLFRYQKLNFPLILGQ